MESGKEKKVVKKFNDEAPRYDNRYKGMNSTAHSFNMRRQRVFELVGDKKGKVLDVGCGPGVMVDGFKAKDYDFYGVDLAQDMIDKCLEKYGNLDNDYGALKEMYRVLRPGGVAIITLPNKKSPYRIWNKFVIKNLSKVVKMFLGGERHGLDHREYREEEYKESMQNIGFRVGDTFYYNFQILPFPIDKYLPFLTVPISKFFEKFYKGNLRWLGTGFIVSGVKK